jgi:multidrug transporter EmrE-like cation transporter
MMLASAHTASLLRTTACIVVVSALAIAGESLIAAGMKGVGDLDDIRAHSGLPGAIKAVCTNVCFLLGATCMGLNFFALLYTLSKVDLSLAAPGTASLTYIGNAIVGKFLLHERVDSRRWLAAICVAVGVVLISL